MKLLISRAKSITHIFNKIKVIFLRGLDRIDVIPLVIRVPVGVVLIIFGFFALYIPFINGIIPMIVGARMLGKEVYRKMYNRLLTFFTRRYKSLRSALFHTLKD